MSRSIVRALAGLTLFAATSTAQSGPFADGELLLRIDDLGPETLYRIDPTTGNAVALGPELSGGAPEAGWLAFDSHRDGVLAFTASSALGYLTPRLLLIREDGGVTDLLGFTSDAIKAIAPTGDGRVYFRKGGVLHVLDVANVLSPVLDHLGQAITLDLQQIGHDAASNSLIGVVAANSSGLPCDGPGVLSVHALPLAPGGTQLAGPIVCNSIATASTWPIGLDPLASGDLLLTFADKHPFQPNPLIQIDPLTLVGMPWAASDLGDLNGGVWCQSIGAAVVWDDGGNELRTYAQGGSGAGNLLPTSIQVGGSTTGTSVVNAMSDVDFVSTPCAGFVRTLGTGSPGTGGRVPLLGVGTCPSLGSVMPVTLSNGPANELGFLVFSARQTSLSLFGGTLYVRPPFVETRVLLLDGDGFGRVDFPIPNDPSVAGVSFFGQAAVRDSAATGGWSLTQAVELQVQ